jgi:transposase
VHELFCIFKYLNEAVDKVRRAEHPEPQQAGEDRVKAMRQALLFNPDNLGDEEIAEVGALRKTTLPLVRA